MLPVKWDPVDKVEHGCTRLKPHPNTIYPYDASLLQTSMVRPNTNYPCVVPTMNRIDKYKASK